MKAMIISLLLCLFINSRAHAQALSPVVPQTNEETESIKDRSQRIKDWAKRQAKRLRLIIEESQWPELDHLSKRLALKAGPSVAYRVLRADFHTEDRFFTPGLNTQVSFSITPQWHVALLGHIFLGKNGNLDFDVNGQRLSGNGNYSAVSFGPVIHYTFKQQLAPTWHYFTKLGPIWSMQTIKLDPFTDAQGRLRSDHKVTYQSSGGLIGVGIEEVLPYKSMHPFYAEIIFKYMQGRKVAVVDASDFTEIETITYDDKKTRINGMILLLNIGITVF